MNRFSQLSLTSAVLGLILNIFMISLSGVPISIPLGIFSIAFAFVSKEGGQAMPSKSKAAIILAIIAISFGLLIFLVTIATTSALSDPIMSKEIIETFNPIKQQLPSEMQQLFSEYGF